MCRTARSLCVADQAEVRLCHPKMDGRGDAWDRRANLPESMVRAVEDSARGFSASPIQQKASERHLRLARAEEVTSPMKCAGRAAKRALGGGVAACREQPFTVTKEAACSCRVEHGSLRLIRRPAFCCMLHHDFDAFPPARESAGIADISAA